MLRVYKASKTYHEVKALTDLSFTLPKNKILGIAGRSGSGKSTLLLCIQGLAKLTEGEIQLQGKAALMFQNLYLFPHMNVIENLTYAPNKLYKTTNFDRAVKLLQVLKIKDKAHNYPHELSGGQQQRVALARCLMVLPDILLCDEPTSGLDVGTKEEVISLLREVKNLGVTMVITSHDLDFLLAISDEIMLLENGKKVLHKPSKYFSKNNIVCRLMGETNDSE
ncbi:MAG: hypothetical protein A3F18_03865 [Legionellales bacterium RIFCSPHIGHO2_12_FULL_37_14]|nr:MAG: hypothetical protein A3F18_03865 [Legionellales bacterium RIFCSPHIGHO2_12_FULL_37_14]